MNGDADKGLLPNPWPILMVVLLATGVLVDKQPLRSARPAAPESIEVVPVDEQDVSARLWQDPIAAVEKYEKHRNSASDQPSPRHTPERVRTILRDIGVDKVTVLAVSVFGAPYAAAAETRRRWRFGVVSALGRKGYLPARADAVGYFRVDLPRAADQSSLIVPYEWFSHDGDPPRHVLVLWLNENRISGEPNAHLQHILSLLDPYGDVQAPVSGALALNVKLIGPSGSDMLANLIRERAGCRMDGADGNDAAAALKYCNTFEVFAQGATVPTADLFAKAGVAERGRTDVGAKDLEAFAIVRTTGADDELAAALLAELRRRGIGVEPGTVDGEHKNGEHKKECADGLVLIREWDTQYSRRLSNYLTSNFREGCTREFTYLRGLDGALPHLGKQQNGPAPKNETTGSEDFPAGFAGASPEHADGRSQYDYLRRVAEQIEALDTGRGIAKNGVKAIGIVGSDVYDKLLILQALRPFFRDAVFFTTDLDARYLHADQNSWTRNLVVASNFGLVLRPELQGSTPPFRGSYQTATYLATLMALEDKPLDFWNQKTWLRPRIFEIGRRHAVPLFPGPSAAGQGSGSRDCAPNWTDCARIEPIGRAASPGLKIVAVLAAVALIAFLLLALTSSRLQVWMRSLYNDAVSLDRNARRRVIIKLGVAGAAALAVLGGIGWAWYGYEQSLFLGEGEPFFWLEGISVWPSLVLRFAGVLVVVIAAAYFMLRNDRRAKEISEHFFGDAPPAPRRLDRSRWRAAFTGPHLDLTRSRLERQKNCESIGRGGRPVDALAHLSPRDGLARDGLVDRVHRIAERGARLYRVHNVGAAVFSGAWLACFVSALHLAHPDGAGAMGDHLLGRL